MEWARLRWQPLWRAHDLFDSLDTSLRVESKASPDGVLFCRLDLPCNLPRIERSAVGNGFNLHPRPILNSMSFGVHALCLFERHGRFLAAARGVRPWPILFS